VSRFSATVRLEDDEDGFVQTGLWEFNTPARPADESAHRSQIRDLLECVGQAIVDANPRGVYYVLRPAALIEISGDLQIRTAAVRADTGLPTRKLAVVISLAEAATAQLPVVPDLFRGMNSAVEMQWAAARLLIECAAKNLREAHALLAPYEHEDYPAAARNAR
jgi:hypothetical protein